MKRHFNLIKCSRWHTTCILQRNNQSDVPVIRVRSLKIQRNEISQITMALMEDMKWWIWIHSQRENSRRKRYEKKFTKKTPRRRKAIKKKRNSKMGSWSHNITRSSSHNNFDHRSSSKTEKEKLWDKRSWSSNKPRIRRKIKRNGISRKEDIPAKKWKQNHTKISILMHTAG